MLSDQEQRVWNDVQRFWAVTTEEPASAGRAAVCTRKRLQRGQGDIPVWAVGGAWIAILLVLFGAAVAGLALGAVTGLGWALWRYWPELTGQYAPAPTLSVTGEMPAGDETARRPAERSWHRRLRENS